MASSEILRRVPSLAIIRGLITGLEEGREFRHSRPEDGVRAPQYMVIHGDLSHHCEIKAELQALGYEYQWQQKRWPVLRDSG